MRCSFVSAQTAPRRLSERRNRIDRRLTVYGPDAMSFPVHRNRNRNSDPGRTMRARRRMWDVVWRYGVLRWGATVALLGAPIAYHGTFGGGFGLFVDPRFYVVLAIFSVLGLVFGVLFGWMLWRIFEA